MAVKIGAVPTSAQHRSRAPGISAGITTRDSEHEPCQEVLPADLVNGCLGSWQVPVDKVQAGACGGWRERELYSGAARREFGAARHAPAHHYAVRRIDLQVTAADRDTVDVDLERAARHRFECRVLAHPADHRGRVGKVPENLL